MPDTVFPYDDEVRDPYDDGETKNPHEETGEETEDDGGDDEETADDQPAKRRPGRPRKNPAP